MSTTMPFGESTSRRVEATYSTPDVVAQRRLIRAALDLKPGEDVLDIGSGPGFLACEMAETIGPAGSVTGLDASDAMLALASARASALASVQDRPAGSALAPLSNGGICL